MHQGGTNRRCQVSTDQEVGSNLVHCHLLSLLPSLARVCNICTELGLVDLRPVQLPLDLPPSSHTPSYDEDLHEIIDSHMDLVMSRCRSRTYQGVKHSCSGMQHVKTHDAWADVAH